MKLWEQLQWTDSFLYVITKSTATVLVTDLNNTNANVTSLAGVQSSGVQGNANYIVYNVPNLKSHVSITANDELYVSYVNRNTSGASGAFYSGFTKNPEINLDKISLTEDFCLPNVNLVVDGIGSYDSFSVGGTMIKPEEVILTQVSQLVHILPPYLADTRSLLKSSAEQILFSSLNLRR